MRTLRLTLVGTVILVLLGGLGGAVGAQGDADGSASFTMRIAEDELGFWNDKTVFIWEVEASDPRLSGTWTRTQDCLDGLDDVGENFTHCVGSVRVENEGGTWLGRFENAGGGMQPRWMEWTRLEGQGDYAGLTVFMYSDDEMGRELDGAGRIIDVELPMPELPPAE